MSSVPSAHKSPSPGSQDPHGAIVRTGAEISGALAQAETGSDLSVRSFITLFGGVNGLLDSSLSTIVFVVLNFVAALDTALIVSVIVALAVVVMRKVRGESMQQALGGFAALLVAVLFAHATGSGKGFFLPGIILTAVSGLLFLGSIVLRRPAIAMALVAIDEKYAIWPEHPALRRACIRATGVWAASFFIRAAVASIVALSIGNDPSSNAILFGVIQVEKWILIVGSALYTVGVIKGVPITPTLEPVQP